jgi:hypothetical protein
LTILVKMSKTAEEHNCDRTIEHQNVCCTCINSDECSTYHDLDKKEFIVMFSRSYPIKAESEEQAQIMAEIEFAKDWPHLYVSNKNFKIDINKT